MRCLLLCIVLKRWRSCLPLRGILKRCQVTALQRFFNSYQLLTGVTDMCRYLKFRTGVSLRMMANNGNRVERSSLECAGLTALYNFAERMDAMFAALRCIEEMAILPTTPWCFKAVPGHRTPKIFRLVPTLYRCN